MPEASAVDYFSLFNLEVGSNIYGLRQKYLEKAKKTHPDKCHNLNKYPDLYFMSSPLHDKDIEAVKRGDLIVFEQDDKEVWFIHACDKQLKYFKQEVDSKYQGYFLQKNHLSKNDQTAQQKLNLIIEYHEACTTILFRENKFKEIASAYTFLNEPIVFYLYQQIESTYQKLLPSHYDKKFSKKVKELLLKLSEESLTQFLIKYYKDDQHILKRLQEFIRIIIPVIRDFSIYLFSDKKKKYKFEEVFYLVSKSVNLMCDTLNKFQHEKGSSQWLHGLKPSSFMLLVFLFAMEDNQIKFVKSIYSLDIIKFDPNSISLLEPWHEVMMTRCMSTKQMLSGVHPSFFCMILLELCQKNPKLFEKWLRSVDCISDLHDLVIYFLSSDLSAREKKPERNFRKTHNEYQKNIKNLKKPDYFTEKEKNQIPFDSTVFEKIFWRNRDNNLHRFLKDGKLINLVPFSCIDYLLYEIVNLIKMEEVIYQSILNDREKITRENVDDIYTRLSMISSRLAAVCHLMIMCVLKQIVPEFLKNKDYLGCDVKTYIIVVLFNIVNESAKEIEESLAELRINNCKHDFKAWLLLRLKYSRQYIEFLEKLYSKEGSRFHMESINKQDITSKFSYLTQKSSYLFFIMVRISALDLLHSDSSFESHMGILNKIKIYLKIISDNNQLSKKNIKILSKYELILNPDQDNYIQSMIKEISYLLYNFNNKNVNIDLINQLVVLQKNNYDERTDLKLEHYIQNYSRKIESLQKEIVSIEEKAYESNYALWLLIIIHMEEVDVKNLILYCYNNITGSRNLHKLTQLLRYPKDLINLLPSKFDNTPSSKVVDLNTLSKEHYQSLESYLILLSTIRVFYNTVDFKKHFSKLEKLKDNHCHQRYYFLQEEYKQWVGNIGLQYNNLSDNLKRLKPVKKRINSSILKLRDKESQYRNRDLYQEELQSLEKFLKDSEVQFNNVLKIQNNFRDSLDYIKLELLKFKKEVQKTPPLLLIDFKGLVGIDDILKKRQGFLKEMAQNSGIELEISSIEVETLPTDEAIQGLGVLLDRERKDMQDVGKIINNFKNSLSMIKHSIHSVQKTREQQHSINAVANNKFKIAERSLNSLINFYKGFISDVNQSIENPNDSPMNILKKLNLISRSPEAKKFLEEIVQGDIEYTTFITNKKHEIDFLYQNVKNTQHPTSLFSVDKNSIDEGYQLFQVMFSDHCSNIKKEFLQITEKYHHHCKVLLEKTTQCLDNFIKYDLQKLQYDGIMSLANSFEEQYTVLKSERDTLIELTTWYRQCGIALACNRQMIQDIEARITSCQDAWLSVTVLLQKESPIASFKKRRKKQNKTHSFMQDLKNETMVPSTGETAATLSRSASAATSIIDSDSNPKIWQESVSSTMLQLEESIVLKNLEQTILAKNYDIIDLRLQSEGVKDAIEKGLYKYYLRYDEQILYPLLVERLKSIAKDIQLSEQDIRCAKEKMSDIIRNLIVTALGELLDLNQIDNSRIKDMISRVNSGQYQDFLWTYSKEEDKVLFQISAIDEQELAVVLNIPSASTRPVTTIARLCLAIESYRKVDENKLYLKNISNILEQMELFLQECNLNQAHGVEQQEDDPIELYRIELTEISNIAQAASQEVLKLEKQFFSYNNSDVSYDEKRSIVDRLTDIFNQLCNKLVTLSTRFGDISKLDLHIDRLHIPSTLSLLFQVVTEAHYRIMGYSCESNGVPPSCNGNSCAIVAVANPASNPFVFYPPPPNGTEVPTWDMVQVPNVVPPEQ